jgi:hypothetical protein
MNQVKCVRCGDIFWITDLETIQALGARVNCTSCYWEENPSHLYESQRIVLPVIRQTLWSRIKSFFTRILS